MINCRGKIISLDTPKIMGILNLTQNSFYDGGKYPTVKSAIEQAEKMLTEGADIIDIGGVSTRPGSKSVTSDEEWQNIEKVLKEIRRIFPQTLISVDTYRADIAKKTIEEGADMINDISSGDFDSEMFSIVAHYNVPYIMMHIKGTPENMQLNPIYDDVIKEILYFFSVRIEKLHLMGVKDIIIDPGIGFGKTVEHNYEIIKNLAYFVQLPYPVLLGVSRKSLIQKVLNCKAEQALNGTTILNTLALQKGVKILRVHDVKEAVEVVKIINYIKD